MENISVDVRLRPVRFAFIVRPDDKNNLNKIFQINTCLWGGMFNPIIPFFTHIPNWWDRDGFKFETPKQIINGYLDHFEPDFIVEAEAGLATGYGFEPERILQIDSVLLEADQDDYEGYGQSVLDLYRKLYHDEFQFVQRNDQNIINVTSDSKQFVQLAACLFGAFPKGKKLDYFETAFNQAFDPKLIKLDTASLTKLYTSKHLSALRMGHDGIEVDYHDHRQPTLFILDATQPRDLLDFWNFRATSQQGIAIPYQWLPNLSTFCKQFILRNHRPLPDNPNGVMIHPMCLFSRSISKADAEKIYTMYLKVNKEGANTLSFYYPAFWRPTPNHTIDRTRPTLTAKSNSVSLTADLEKTHVSFDALSPDFASRYGNEHRWVNVIELEEWGNKSQVATVFPTDHKKQSAVSFGLVREQFLSTREGLISFLRYKDHKHSWDLVDGKQAIEQWLRRDDITCKVSPAGRNTQQIIHTLGGFFGVRSISSKAVIELLNKMANSFTRSIHQSDFHSKIKVAVQNDFWRERTLEILVEQKAVELGQELNCTKCGSWGWYALNQLDTYMQCSLCLKTFDFPITNPTNRKRANWAYRVIGPFALPNYSGGGYSAALAIRFFSSVLGGFDRAAATWSAGLELTFPDNTKLETDFLLWYQRKRLLNLNNNSQIVFGEAKSFGREAFTADDIKRMKVLAEKYTSAILVFATLKEASELSKEEVKIIRKLAEWGREYSADRKTSRAPVIILTGTELFCSNYLTESWKGKSDLHTQFTTLGYIDLSNLKVLADATQQLYLGMPAYSTWREEKWKRKRASFLARQQQKTAKGE
jgi:hypothetical protein